MREKEFFSVTGCVTTGSHWLEYADRFPFQGQLAGRFAFERAFSAGMNESCRVPRRVGEEFRPSRPTPTVLTARLVRPLLW
jgi:hypothetical protein